MTDCIFFLHFLNINIVSEKMCEMDDFNCTVLEVYLLLSSRCCPMVHYIVFQFFSKKKKKKGGKIIGLIKFSIVIFPTESYFCRGLIYFTLCKG
jgi:hypothetical protein